MGRTENTSSNSTSIVACIHCRGNVFTGSLPSNVRGNTQTASWCQELPFIFSKHDKLAKNSTEIYNFIFFNNITPVDQPSYDRRQKKYVHIYFIPMSNSAVSSTRLTIQLSYEGGKLNHYHRRLTDKILISYL
jgi:hypothetical protein